MRFISSLKNRLNRILHRFVVAGVFGRQKQKNQRKPQIVMRNLFIILLLVLFVQLIAIVYAMSLTLLSTTTEDKDTFEILMADFDNDGDLDYVAGNSDATDTFKFDNYVNNGSASFSTSTFSLSTSFSTGVATDIDGDGDVDILSANGATLYKYTNNGSGVFTRTTIASGVSPTISYIITADFDGDGDMDFVGAQTGSPMTSAIYLNNSHGVFTSAVSTLPSIADFCAADLNSDGTIDIALNRGDNTMRAYRNSGTGAFVQLSSTARASMAIPVACGDIDGDGDIDVVGMDSTNIVPFMNNGAGTFSVGTTSASNLDTPNDADLADLDNDGDLDAIISGDASVGTGGSEIYINNGSGVFTSQGSPLNNADGTKSAAIGDLDGDGDLDYIRGNFDSTGAGGGEQNRIYTNDQAATSANTAPTAPTLATLTGTVVSVNSYRTTLDSVGNVGKYTDIALGTDNNPIISYYDQTNGALKVIKCGDTTCSSGNTTTTIASSGNVIDRTEIVVPADGRAVIVYGDPSDSYVLKMVKCGNAACSSGNSVSTIDDAYVKGYGASVAIGTDGFPVISSSTAAGNLIVTKCSDSTCSTAPTEVVVAASGLMSSIAIGTNGFPIISYADNVTVGFRVMQCGNAACTSGNSSTLLTAQAVAGPSTLVIGSDGFPVVQYFDDDLIELTITKCGNAACTSGNTTSAIASGNYFQTVKSTVAIGSDNFPIVSYYDTNLKVVKCGNITCSSGNTTTTVDSSVTVGTDSSIFIGADGKAIISYSDVTNQDLRFLHCGNASCSSGGTNGLLSLRLRWGSGSDTETSTRLLQYQLKLGTGSNTNNIVSAKTTSPNWVGRVMPNGQSRTYLLNIPCNSSPTYYWSVATVDTGFKSTESSEQSFTLNSSCNLISGGGGGSSGGSGGGGSGGGGLSARYFHLNNPVAPPRNPGFGHITVTGYKDYDGNDTRGFREPTGFTGLAFTASGRTIEDNPIRVTQTLNEQGQTTFDLPPSDNRGYSIMTDTGSEILQEYVPTGALPTSSHVLTAGQDNTVDIGFRRATLLAYKPCLTVGMPSDDETKGTDARVLVGRLEDSFGRKIVSGVTMNSGLLTRRDFLKLLAKTQCVPMIQNLQESEAAIRSNAKKLKVTLPLVDLSLDLTKPDAQLVYSLLAAGADITRPTLIGDSADLSSPMTRREVVTAIRTVLPISPERIVTDDGVLPEDLKATDPLVPDFLTVQSLGILPESFLPIFGASQGINSNETALLIVRAAFRGGRISLIPASSFSEIQAPSRPTFLSVLPPVLSRSCLETVPERSTNIRYIDVFPGDVFFDDLHVLLSRGTKNSAQKMLWLLTGTRRPTEFGIQRGQTLSEFSEPVSLIETIRSLLVFACVPPPTAGDVFSGRANGVLQGSGNSRTVRDLISGLPRNASFLSRFMYRAQDHQTEFDQSLFSYYPEFLRQDIRSPMSGLSVAEVSNILASGLLMSEVKAGSLLGADAENRFKELAAAIRKDLLGTDVHWRDAPIVDSIPFTKGMLLQFLSTAVSGRTSVPVIPTPSRLPLGELWWSRIK